MSKSSTLKIRSLFHKTKSLDKENKDVGERNSFRDGEQASPIAKPATLPSNSGLVCDATLPGDIVPSTSKEKKKKMFLPFKLKKRKSKESAGGEVFFNDTDELDSFNSQM